MRSRNRPRRATPRRPTATPSDATEAKKALSARLRQTADRALKRYDKPAGIAADWRAQAEFALKSGR